METHLSGPRPPTSFEGLPLLPALRLAKPHRMVAALRLPPTGNTQPTAMASHFARLSNTAIVPTNTRTIAAMDRTNANCVSNK